MAVRQLELWDVGEGPDQRRSTSCLFANQANTYMRRFPGEVLKPEFLNLTLKHPLKIMVWGCMAASGVGCLHIVNGVVNETKYIGILQKCIVPYQHSSSFMNSSCFRMTMRHVIVPSWSPNGSPRRASGHFTGLLNPRI